jgi:signal peptidase I
MDATKGTQCHCNGNDLRVFWFQMEPVSTDTLAPEANIGAVAEIEIAMPQTSAQGVRRSPGGPRKTSGVVLWFRDLLISAFASVLIITFLYQPVRVEGTSMLPRLEDSDRLFINKFVYHFTAIERGDVVVFRPPSDPERSYIKRVIALPGDRLRIDHGRVIVNGKLIREPYVPLEYRDNRSMAEITIPSDSFFMMGDHRNISYDSRSFGAVPRSLIYGKAVFVYWPRRDLGVVH